MAGKSMKIEAHNMKSLPDVRITRIHDHGLMKEFNRKEYGQDSMKKNMMVVEYDITDLPKMKRHIDEYAAEVNKQYVREIGDDKRMRGEQIWYGGAKSWKEIDDVLLNGWKEGAQRAEELVEAIEHMIPMPQGRRRKPRWMDQGDELDKGRMYAGQIDTMWRAAPRTVGPAPRVISVEVAVGGNAHRKADELYWCGVSAIVLTDALEQAGYRVELWASTYNLGSGWGGDNGPDSWCILNRCRLKEAMEPVRIDSVAAICAHAGVFRTYGFYTFLANPSDIGSGLGSVRDLEPAVNLAAEVGVAFKPDVIVDKVYTKEAAVVMIEDALRQITEGQDYLYENA